MSKELLQKFLVVSYDDDQQQWFWDYVVSRTEQNAVALVCKRRPYVIAADAASLSQIQTMANDLSTRSYARINQQFKWDTTTASSKEDQ
jgi:hypothetical protein